MGDDRPGVYSEGRRGSTSEKYIYRASNVGDCKRALVAMWEGQNTARGEKRETMLAAAADAGNQFEEAVVEYLRGLGWEFESRQTEAEIQVVPKVYVRGHTDGICVDPDNGRRYLLEVKSMSKNQYAKWARTGFDGFRKYAFQISCYMKANAGLDVLYVVVMRPGEEEDETGKLRLIKNPFEHVIEEAKAGRLMITRIPAKKPPVSWGAVMKHIGEVEKYRKMGWGEHPPCDVDDKWFCPFWYLHGEDKGNEGPGTGSLTDEDVSILEELMVRRGELMAITKAGTEAEDARKKLDVEIKNMMGTTKKARIVAGDETWDLTVAPGSSERANVKEMREKLGPAAEEFISKVEYEYVRVTKK